MVARVASTNAGIAAIVLLALSCYRPLSDSIPFRSGLGYDGLHYARWVSTLPIFLFPEGPHPPFVKSKLDSYAARRFLPSVALHGAMRALGVPRTRGNVIAAFAAANLALLALSLYCWGRAADAAGLTLRGKWIGVLALQVSYANWKMPLYYPVLTDTFALALGAISLLCYLERRSLGLVLVMVVGAFVWPTLPYFCFLLLTFPPASPERVQAEESGGPRGWRDPRNWTAGATALLGLVLITFLVRVDYPMPNTPVRPMTSLLRLSGALTALYLFFGLRVRLDSPRLWEELRPLKALGRGRLWLAGFLMIAVEAGVASIAVADADYSGARFLADTFFSSVTQPGIFYLAHVLYLGRRAHPTP